MTVSEFNALSREVARDSELRDKVMNQVRSGRAAGVRARVGEGRARPEPSRAGAPWWPLAAAGRRCRERGTTTLVARPPPPL